MAGITSNLGRVSYQTRVGYLLILGAAVTTVAYDTTHLTMRALDKLGITEEDLLPYLQRR